MLSGRAGVAAGGLCREFYVGLALFKHADHRKVAGNAADWFGNNAATLIADKKQLHTAAAQFLHKLRRAVARPFLRAGRRQIHVRRRRIVLSQQLLGRFKERHDGAFRVRSAAPPDLAVRDIAGERRVEPVALRRDNILMAHKKDRLFRRAALPVKQQIPVDLRLFQPRKDEWEQLRQRLVERAEARRIVSAGVGGRVHPDHLRQLLCQPQRFLLILLRPVVRRFPG